FVKELKIRKTKVSKDVRIAAVGPETAAALQACGFSVAAIPERFTARDMVKSLGKVNGLRILFPRSAIAAKEPVQILRAQGARVQIVPLYYPVPVPLSQITKRALIAGQYTELSFKSPSGIQGFLRQLTTAEKKTALQIPAICIGPTTAKAAKGAGFRRVSQNVL
ncbi:MAG: uroporphyrinogen-III C-methyltransferase, partial [Parcubacteria group bacterium]|nr:uroporphyrinogen-III C-methyltransferase [Parcubacteria group bacterium]